MLIYFGGEEFILVLICAGCYIFKHTHIILGPLFTFMICEGETKQVCENETKMGMCNASYFQGEVNMRCLLTVLAAPREGVQPTCLFCVSSPLCEVVLSVE